MPRRVWVAAAIALIATVAAAYLYVDNRRLRREAARLAHERDALAAAPAPGDPWAAAGARDDDDGDALAGVPRGLGGAIDGVGRPELPDEPKESRLERRKRRQAEVASMLGRLDGETDDEYRARVMPLVGAVLTRPRESLATMRQQVEDAAGVTDAQRQKLDAAFDQVYDDLLTYTDGAVADGQLTPYDLNAAGMLEYAGGLGAILTGAEGQIGEILSPGQRQQIDDSGFEWAEYLGVSAPWERLTPPPPPPGGGS